MTAIIWLALMIMFLIVEALTVSTVSMWFAGGSLAALITALLNGGIWLQIIAFLVVSAILLACLRPIIRKHFTPRIKATNVDAVVGARGYVTADIDNIAATGTVKLGSMEWTARSASGEAISAGTLVKVQRIEGVKAIVAPAEVTANT